MIGISDEHQSIFSPGALQANSDYLFFVATRAKGGAPSTGVVVLSGGSGPDKNGQWTMDFAKADGYGSYASAYGTVFVAPTGPNCPTVADGNPAHQDQTFDLTYAAPGSVVVDPTSGPGNLLMVYEGTNTCFGIAGGANNGNNFYSSVGIATSRDYGHTWPTYRAKSGFSFVPLPGENPSQGPTAPNGALSGSVCMGNNCAATPPPNYGRYPVLSPSVSMSSAMALGTSLPGSMGDSEISAFVDDASASPAQYIYAVYDYKAGTGVLTDPNAPGNGLMIARAELNGGTAPLNFLKWNGQAFSGAGRGGYDSLVFPTGPFANCEGPAQLIFGASISYVDVTQQYLLTFVCDSPGDPALGQVAGAARGGAWFYSTSYDLSDPTQWTAPQEIAGSWSAFDQSGGCSDYKGFYPTLMSLGSKTGHLSVSGYVFYLWGCQTDNTPPPGRQYSSRVFTITTTGAPPPGPPTISLSNTQLQFWDYTAQSSLTPPQAVGVSNAGGGTLSFTATPNAPWIDVTSTSSDFTVSVNPAGLALGPHMSTISVASPGATNTPQTVTVTLTVSASAQIPPASAARFVPVTPCRIADTRNPNGPFGGPTIGGNTSRDFAIPSSPCGIPFTAAAYSMNVAVVPGGPLGYLTLWPTGQPQPLVATLNSLDGRVKSNAAIVPAGASGAISVFVTDTTDVILDINGYFVAGNNPAALAFYPLTPCRVADTRNAAGPLGGPSLAAKSTRAFPIQASPCGLPASAQAYSLNFAAVPKGPTLGYMTAWPAGQSQPLVASLNDPTGTVLANAVVVPAGAGGAVDVYTTDTTDLVIDINGYFAPPGAGGLSLYTVTPCRVLDSRLPAGTPPFSTTIDVNVTASPCGIPATAKAFVFNATVVPPGPLGYITMWPQGQTQPLAATLNAYDGAVTNNMAIVPTTTGSISVFPLNPTHLVLDIFGYFAP